MLNELKECVEELRLTKTNEEIAGALAEYAETWEARGNWQGTVRKYSQVVIERVKTWLVENDYPESIPYVMGNGMNANCHVIYQKV